MNSLLNLTGVCAELARLADAQTASFLKRFFKTGPGDYGAGDLFRGIRVPTLRRLARAYQNLTLAEIQELLHSAYHEDRLLSLLILVRRYSGGDAPAKSKIYDLYLKNTRHVNNWDLVDASAAHIVGAFLQNRDRGVLYRLAGSADLWERRIAIIATFHFIKREDFGETLRIAEMLLADREDLIHKAVGWMLREVGKRDLQAEESFLRAHGGRMPRVMLRYAIEKFTKPERRKYLSRASPPG